MTFSSGAVLTAAQLNGLQTTFSNGDNNILNGDTFTGNMNWYSGVDALFYSDAGSTLKAGVYADNGKILGAIPKTGAYNIGLARATTTNAGDSIKVQCGEASCSASNPGIVVIGDSTTAGVNQVFYITSDVTILLTGAHWDMNLTGDVNGVILRTLFINDFGTLRTCVARVGGRHTVLKTDTNATQASVNLPEEILCNTAVSSSSNTALEFGYFRANFDDTGGVAENLWAIQTGLNDVVVGQSADGISQPYNPLQTGGTSPGVNTVRWSQIGEDIFISADINITSTTTTYTVTTPTKSNAAAEVTGIPMILAYDNNTFEAGGYLSLSTDSTRHNLFRSGATTGTWTAANGKRVIFSGSYKVGPAASFIE
jgi:hypothetical protein